MTVKIRKLNVFIRVACDVTVPAHKSSGLIAALC